MSNFVVSQRNTFLHFQVVRKNARKVKRPNSAPPCFNTPVELIDRQTPAAPVLEVLFNQGDRAVTHEERRRKVPTTEIPERVMKWSDADQNEACTFPDEAWSSTSIGASSDSGSTAGEDEHRRTTWMLKNVPGRVTKEEVLQAIARLGFGGMHDYFYMPTKLSGNHYVSRGYAFVGFADFEVGDRFREAITGFQFPGRCSAKRIEVSPARLQSLEDIEDHFKSSGVVGSLRGPLIGGTQGLQFTGQSAPAAARPAYANNYRQRQQQSLRRFTPAVCNASGFQASGCMVATGVNQFGAQHCLQQSAYSCW